MVNNPSHPKISLITTLTILVLVLLFSGILWVKEKVPSISFLYDLGLAKYDMPHEDISAQVLDIVQQKIPEPNMTVLVGGDVMLDRGVRLIGNKYGYDSLFASTTPIFQKQDIVAVNLEGPITSHLSQTLLPNGQGTQSFTFTFATTTAGTLARSHINLVSLANNHSGNFGREGLEETRRWLEGVGVGYFGDPWNSPSKETVICKNEICVAFLGYHAFHQGFENILADISRLNSEGYFVIVMPHWGEEYVPLHSLDMRTKAETMVSAGADAIVGSHPHVIMDHQWLGEVPVFYSLGNLLFDQYFSKETMVGEMVEFHLAKNSDIVKIQEIKVYEISNASRRGINILGERMFSKP